MQVKRLLGRAVVAAEVFNANSLVRKEGKLFSLALKFYFLPQIGSEYNEETLPMLAFGMNSDSTSF